MGKGLPYDAAVEWIGVRQNAWVVLDNGFIPNDNNVKIDTEMTFISYPTSTSYAAWFVARTSSNSGSYRMIRGANSTDIFLCYNVVDSNNYRVSLRPAANTRYSIHLEYSKAIINNTRYNINTNTISQNESPFIIGDYGVARGTNLNVHSFVVTHNDIAVIDAIPVRKGQVGYLYDRVTKRLFGTAGENPLIVGPDV